MQKCVKRVATGVALAALMAAGVATAGENLVFERTATVSEARPGARRRAAGTTLIYARIQPYDLYSNYLGEWIDRPLFHDRSLREVPPDDGFRLDAEISLSYGIDGFTMLSNGYANRYRNFLHWLPVKWPAFSFMPGIVWSGPYERYLENARLALASDYSPRIGGKVPFFSYGNLPLDKIAELREKLAADGAADMLLFGDVWFNVFGDFARGKGTLPAETLEKAKNELQAKLDVLDGVVYINHHMFRDPKGDYTLKWNYVPELERKYMIPMVEEVYARPENRDKLLGFNIRHGYIGHMSGTNEAELGTGQLRACLDAATRYNPDILSLVEWNEANENTSFQPSVTNGTALRRIVHYYADLLKGRPSTPAPGDDMSVPNLIVSSRQTIKLGEQYRIELLNVPDGAPDATYKVELTLKDLSGRVLKTFPADTFHTGTLADVTYRIPSEQLDHCEAVLPELRIVTPSGGEMLVDTLQYTRIDPTVCWNFKEIRQPLRDLLKPVAADFTVLGQNADGSWRVSGSLDAGEALASLEVTDREGEVCRGPGKLDRGISYSSADTRSDDRGGGSCAGITQRS